MPTIQHLLSLPPCGTADFQFDRRRPFPHWHADSDPPGQQLGSGGGTAWLLYRAWQRQCQLRPLSFVSWLCERRRIVIHAGGESRRLPAYAPGGKSMLPVPAMRWSHGQHLEQNLLDLQKPFLDHVLRYRHEPCLVIACGDVLLRGEIDQLPETDVVVLGMWTTPEQASRHGVFFCPHEQQAQLSFALQKPTPGRVRELAENHFFLIDTGCWVLSLPAILAMMRKSGWDEENEKFLSGPRFYDLYTDFGQSLGSCPTCFDQDVSNLTASAVPVRQGGFYHLGTSRELISTTYAWQNLQLEQDQNVGRYPRHPSIFLQNAQLKMQLHNKNQNIWIENSYLNENWRLNSDHVITGIPENDWQLELPDKICLDLIPVEKEYWAVRVYGIDDGFKGELQDENTAWMGQPAQKWFADRGLTIAECGLKNDEDLQQAKLFPVMRLEQLQADFLQWLCGNTVADNETAMKAVAEEESAPPAIAALTTVATSAEHAALYRQVRRLSASELTRLANLGRLAAQRHRLIELCLPVLYAGGTKSVFLRLDLRRTAAQWHEADLPLSENRAVAEHDLFAAAREQMFRSEVWRRQGKAEKALSEEKSAFALLAEALTAPVRAERVVPQCCLLEDQVLWTRSPVRLDLAGGWTDTPPQCFFAGGTVLNLAAELNGQPPLQCYIRRNQHNTLVIRSIDLGCEEQVGSYEQLRQYTEVGNAFSIPKAALALCGFQPEFHQAPPATLPDLLRQLGGGLELTMLSALPKGSGLGTSSILAATILGALNEVCGLGWSNQEVIRRTSVLEQMLTTGGGWQDQAGGIIPGVKLLETRAGLYQVPQPSWLPDRMFAEHANRDMILYYTGITRVAKDILHEVVRGMFLNSQHELAVLTEMGKHAREMARQIQRGNWNAVGKGLSKSWSLNCALDPGTNPHEVQKIFATVQEELLGAKLLGAGGGGYLLMIAKSEEHSARIRQKLSEQPPNARARFVTMQVSTTGMQVTRS